MARPFNRSKTYEVPVTLPEDTRNYLVQLATKGMFAPTEAGVAAHIIVREVTKMKEDMLHLKKTAAPEEL